MAVDLFQPVDRGDVRVVERGEEPRLALETGQPFRVAGEGVGERLDGHVAAEPGVAGAVDLAHAAGAEGSENLVGSEFRSGGETHFFFNSAVQSVTTIRRVLPRWP